MKQMTDLELEKYRSGSTEPWTVDVLCAFVRATKPKVLLETGTYKGLTTLALAGVMPTDAILHTVDNEDAGAHPTFSDERIKYVKSDIMEWLKDYKGPGFNFAFVDDDHKPAHVTAVLNLLISRMAPNGLITGHDVIGHFNLAPVYMAFGGTALKLPLLHCAGGLGVIQL
jgi:predicted O-methyltransferase YrrM